MHPFVQAGICVFVGLVVLGPAPVEVLPEALETAPSASSSGLGGTDATAPPLRDKPRLLRLGHADLLATDAPQALNTAGLVRLASLDILRIRKAPTGILSPDPPAPSGQLTGSAPAGVAPSAQTPLQAFADRDANLEKPVRTAGPSGIQTDHQTSRAVPAARHNLPNPAGLPAPRRIFRSEPVRPDGPNPIPPQKQALYAAIHEPPPPFQPRLINGDFVNLRTEPSLSAESVTQLNTGDWVLVTGVVEGNWVQALSQEGEEVWIYNRYLSEPDTEGN